MLKGLKSLSFYLIIPTFLAVIFNNFVTNNFLLSNVIFYLILLLFFVFIERKDIKKDFKDLKPNFKMYIPIIFKWIIIEFLLMIISNYMLGLFVDNLPNNELSNRDFLVKSTPLAISYLLIIAPCLEEYVFRYSFKKIKNYYIYTIVPSILFCSLHLLSIDDVNHLLYVIPYFIMSFGFSNIYYKCQNYFSSVIGHIIHNTLCVIIILI